MLIRGIYVKCRVRCRVRINVCEMVEEGDVSADVLDEWVRRKAGFWSYDLQSEGFFVETVMIFDFVQSLFLERSFNPMEHVVNVMLLLPRKKIE